MVMLAHVTAAKLEPKILRSGLRATGGVYAFPVLESYTLTHQWTREILKWRRQPMMTVYFRVPDNEMVEYGRYNEVLKNVPAAAAVASIRAQRDPRGFQIVISRVIKPRDITRVAAMRGVVGWRHMPDAHGRKPCGCPACVARGEPGGSALRARYERGEI